VYAGGPAVPTGQPGIDGGSRDPFDASPPDVRQLASVQHVVDNVLREANALGDCCHGERRPLVTCRHVNGLGRGCRPEPEPQCLEFTEDLGDVELLNLVRERVEYGSEIERHGGRAAHGLVVSRVRSSIRTCARRRAKTSVPDATSRRPRSGSSISTRQGVRSMIRTHAPLATWTVAPLG
jgi:hypothetical protein